MTFDFSTLQEQFYKLPEEVQFALTSPHITEQIRAIAEKNGLLLDQMETLYDITSYVMLGLLPGDRYTSTLAKEMNVSEKQARTITDEINNEVFRGIRDSMREFEERSKRVDSAEREQLQNQYQSPAETREPPSVDSSIHADLEQAGNFKIETEASLDSNYSLKSPPRKTAFVTEQNIENNQNRAVNMAKLTPTQPNPEPISTPTMPPAELEPKTSIPENASKMQAFDPKNFYNFGNIEERIDMKKDEKTEEKEPLKVEDAMADKDAPLFQKSASTIHYEKAIKNKHTKIAASQAYQPKINNIPSSLSTEQNKVIAEQESTMEKENTALIDEMIAHPKPIIEETKISTTPTVQVENKPEPTPLIIKNEIKTETVAEQKLAEPPINLPVEEIPTVVVQEEPNKFVNAFDTKKEEEKTEKQETPTVVIDPPINVDSTSINLIKKEYPEIKKSVPEKPITTEPVKIPTSEEIRNDIRSKVSEYNPSTKWETPVPKPVPAVPIQTPVSPKITPTQPPNRPSGFDPYREQIK